MAQRVQQSKYWVFTLNNYTELMVQAVKNFIRVHCNYGVFGYEVAPNTGTPHLQGYLECKTRKRMRTIKTLMGLNGIHLSKRRGSAAQASDYCKKDENEFWEYGEISDPEPGKRNDIHKIRDLITNGSITNVMHLINEVSSVQSFSIGSRLLHITGASRDREVPVVFWLYGSTGTGKTRAVYDWRSRAELPLWKSGTSGLKWFDGYAGQPIALFDDFRWDGRRSTYTKLLQLCDRYVAGVEFKGGSTWFTSKYIFITSPTSPTDVFRELPHEDPINQLLRRINARGGIYNFDDANEKSSFNSRIEQYLELLDDM